MFSVSLNLKECCGSLVALCSSEVNLMDKKGEALSSTGSLSKSSFERSCQSCKFGNLLVFVNSRHSHLCARAVSV